jgi:hypothetical protein
LYRSISRYLRLVAGITALLSQISKPRGNLLIFFPYIHNITRINLSTIIKLLHCHNKIAVNLKKLFSMSYKYDNEKTHLIVPPKLIQFFINHIKICNLTLHCRAPVNTAKTTFFPPHKLHYNKNLETS